jgi:hypothetical protein
MGDAMRKKTLCSAVLGFFICSGRGFAATPLGIGAANEEMMKQQAAVELVVKVSSITYFKDETLVFGGYNCLNGVIYTVKVNRKNASGQDRRSARAKGDKVSILLDCQPDDVPFGPGQVAKELCSQAKKARWVKVWSGLVNFPVPQAKGCPQPDSGFKILK